MKNNRSIIVKEEPLVSKLLTVFINYWPVFFVFAVLLISGAFIYLRYATPKYQATASLIIKDDNKGNSESKLMESLNFISQKKIIENEIEVLKSRNIINEVVKKLHLYAPIYRAGRISSFSAYGDAPISIEFQQPEKIEGISKNIYFIFNQANATVLINDTILFPVYQWVPTPLGVLRFIPNEQYRPIKEDRKFYFKLLDMDLVAKELAGNLKVSATNKLSSIINLQYIGNRPKLSEDVLNELIVAYKNIELKEKSILASNTLKFIDQRLDIVRKDLDNIETSVRSYKGNSDAVDIGTQGQLYLENVSANDKKISELDMQLSVINELEKKVTVNDVKVGILPASLGVIDPTLSQLVNSLNTAELELEKLKKTVAENNPLLVSVKDQITNTKTKISENINSYRKSLESSKQNLYANNKTYSNLLRDIPQKEQTLLEISRDNKIKSDIYSFLLQKREESELSYASTIVDSRIINYAQSSQVPVSPNKMILFGSILLGMFILPIGTISAREKFTKSILYRNDIEDLTNIPIIGELSYNKPIKGELMNADNFTLLDEFRRLRYSLAMNSYGIVRRKIMISSGITGEGKSFVAANLAKSYALAGKRVVLVDFDLYNSSLKEQFGVMDEVGVSNYLANEVALSEIIFPVSDTDNLYYIPSGTYQKNPFSLLESEFTHGLMEFLDKNFDIIIIDSAPVIQVTDAYVLTRYCDTTLFIVKHGYSPKKLVKILEFNNESNLLKDPVIVFNGVKTSRYLNNNYGYGYKSPYRRKAIANG